MTIHSDPQIYELSRSEIITARRDKYAITAACLIGDELTVKIPDFHFEVWDELQAQKRILSNKITGHQQKLFTVPREHSKTTLVKLAAVNLLRTSDLSFLMYVGSTHGSAANACRDIVAWFMKESEEQLWGPTKLLKSNESDGLWQLRIRLENGREKEITIRAVGQSAKIRGMNIGSKRPDLVIIDDIEDLDTADSGKNQKKLDEWFFGTLLKATAKKSLRIFIGNIIRDTTLLARLSKDSNWNPTKFGALVRDKTTGVIKPLWPEMHTVDSLLTEYRDYRSKGVGHVWESEMMNLSRDLTLADSIGSECLFPDPDPSQVEVGFIVVDPAFGVKKENDETAITVHVRLLGAKIPGIIDSRVGRFTEKQTFDHVIELCYQWGLRTIAIEAVAAQRLLIPLFKMFCKEQGVSEDTLILLPISGSNSADAKASRIKGFRDACKSNSYGIAESQVDVKLRLEEWSPETTEHDDLPDSSSFGPHCWEKEAYAIKEYGGRINNIGSLLYDAVNESDYQEYSENHVANI